MDKYTKGFVVASLVYLFIAAGLGGWMGAAETPVWARFGHMHFNLLGFMAMMVYGVGYFILPRFNARVLVWPSWVPVHFYLANIGLVGMVVTSGNRPSASFVGFSICSVLSVAMFALNIGATMVSAEEHHEEATAAPPTRPEIPPDMRMGEILNRWPQVVPVLVENGFPSLGDPHHQEQVKQMPITLAMACQRHGVDVDTMRELLADAAAGFGKGPTPGGKGGTMPGRDGGLSRGERISSKHIIGEILKVYPETETVFRKYYGAACFSCPGQATETVTQSAMMHNVDEKTVLEELNDAVAAEGS